MDLVSFIRLVLLLKLVFVFVSIFFALLLSKRAVSDRRSTIIRRVVALLEFIGAVARAVGRHWLHKEVNIDRARNLARRMHAAHDHVQARAVTAKLKQ